MPNCWIKREWLWGMVAGVVAVIMLLALIVRALGASTPESRFIKIEATQAEDHVRLNTHDQEIGEIKTGLAVISTKLDYIKAALPKK